MTYDLDNYAQVMGKLSRLLKEDKKDLVAIARVKSEIFDRAYDDADNAKISVEEFVRILTNNYPVLTEVLHI